MPRVDHDEAGAEVVRPSSTAGCAFRGPAISLAGKTEVLVMNHKRSSPKRRLPLLVTGLSHLPATIPTWEWELLEPILVSSQMWRADNEGTEAVVEGRHAP